MGPKNISFRFGAALKIAITAPAAGAAGKEDRQW